MAPNTTTAKAPDALVPLQHGALSALLPPSWKDQVGAWLAEDTPSFDYGGFVVGDVPRTATLWAKSPGVVAGVPFVDEIFARCGCTVAWAAGIADGARVGEAEAKTACAVVSGPARGLLLAERVALNVLARCSGVATRTAAVVGALRAAGYRGRVAGTRKTTPGFRLVEKYGMLVGGADMHRVDLSAMVMLKDNHVWSRGSIGDAVAAAQAVAGFALKVEVEVQSEAEADEALAAGADVVMLDNFSPAGVAAAAASLRARWTARARDATAAGGRAHGFLIEVSGGLTADNMEAYVCNDIDIISTSYIHQGVPHVDFSLKINH